MSYWHFTSLMHAEDILQQGVILPTESNVSFTDDHHGPDVVWLLDTPTVQFSHGLTEHKTAARFEVEVPAIKWTEWEWTSRMEDWVRRALVKSGGGEEAADHWFIWPAGIHRRNWLSADAVTQAGPEVIFKK